jgi:hypothetical protein
VIKYKEFLSRGYNKKIRLPTAQALEVLENWGFDSLEGVSKCLIVDETG